jgi:LuxR family maltose regulon positive regulatory protein
MSKEANDLQLFYTKLNRPRLTGDLVPRPGLLDHLNRRLERPLALVVAPAGYGKTTLVSAWLESRDGPSAWLSLDEHDNDLTTFLTYFLAAIQTMFPEVCADCEALLRAAALPPVSVIVRSLVNELNDIDRSYLLVLDDYHAIHEPAINELLTELVRYPPAGMQLVLTSRRNPLLPLTQLRARGLMTEIRTQDLRFTMAEATALLQQLTETEIDEATVSLLEEKTEGWVTGLRLAVLSIRHRGDLDNLLAGLQDTSQYVMDYLISEVLSYQPPDVQAFLVRSSVLDRLSGPLSEAVVGLAGPTPTGQAYLETVARANLFIIPLDDRQQWFRYHHLFQQFLLHRLQQQHSPEEIAALHARATDWFAQNGLVEEALHHALAAGDTPQAVQLVAQHRLALMNQDGWQRLGRWLRLFPDQVVQMEPELLMLDAWLKQTRWQLGELSAVLERIETLLSQSSPPGYTGSTAHLQDEINALRAAGLLYSVATEDALAYLTQILLTIPPNHYYVRGYVVFALGIAYQMAGDTEAANTLVSEGLLEMPRNEMFQTRLLGTLSIVNWMAADLENLWLASTRCLEISKKANSVLGLTAAQHFQGCVHYHRNNLAAAERAFTAIVDRPYLAHALTFTHSAIGLASTYQAQGRPDQAREVIDSTIAFMLETHNTLLLPVAEAFRAELAARQGRLAEAGQWAVRVGPTPPRQGMPSFYGPQLALPKVLLAQNTAESRQQAADYLAQLHGFVKSIHNTRFLIEVLALQALLHQAQGNRTAALDALAQAVTLARPGGFIRLFVDLGPEMELLLADLAQNSVAPDYIAQIRAAFDSSVPQGDEGLIEDRPQPPERSPHPDPLESLTNREMDVLLLMADRLTNKEIAQRLGISAETVKQHAFNLYRKLHVNNRRQAVAKARDLDLLPPD